MTERVRLHLRRPYRAIPVTLALGLLMLLGVVMVWYGVADLRTEQSGGAWVVVISMAVLAVACSLGLLGVWSRAVVVEGGRVAYSTVFGARGWMELREVTHVGHAVAGNGPEPLRQRNIVLSAPSGGHGGLVGRLQRLGLGASGDRSERSRARAETTGLRSLSIPISELRADDVETLHRLLADGLEPSVADQATRAIRACLR